MSLLLSYLALFYYVILPNLYSSFSHRRCNLRNLSIFSPFTSSDLGDSFLVCVKGSLSTKTYLERKKSAHIIKKNKNVICLPDVWSERCVAKYRGNFRMIVQLLKTHLCWPSNTNVIILTSKWNKISDCPIISLCFFAMNLIPLGWQFISVSI